MSKASLAPTTVAPVTAPAQPSRRRLLAGSGLAAGLAVLALPAAAAAVAPAPADPVVALCAKWLALEAANKIANERHLELRNMLVSRYGECKGYVFAQDHWGHDPSYPEFSAVTDRSDELGDAAADTMDLIMDTPAASIEGVRCKVMVLAETWAYIERRDSEPEWHETVTLAMLRDAARFMGAGAAA